MLDLPLSPFWVAAVGFAVATGGFLWFRLARADKASERAVSLPGGAPPLQSSRPLLDVAEAPNARPSRLLEATLASMGEGLLVLDADLRVLVMNAALRRFMDIPPTRTAEGEPILDLLIWLAGRGTLGEGSPEQVAGAVIDQLARAASGVEPGFELELPDGRTFLLSADRLPQGGIVATFTDVTEQKNTVRVLSQARDAAEQANAAKTHFLASMSHELRTPLNSIIGFAGMIRDEALGPVGAAEYKTYADEVQKSGRELLGIINDILDIARLEAGTLTISDAILSPVGVITCAIEEFGPLAEASGIRLETALPDDAPMVRGDERRIRQAVGHLMSNAIKFSAANTTIRVSASSRDDGGFTLSVTDQGVGMTREQIETALMPFRQVEASLDRSYGGTGIGLAIVHGITTLHGGVLEIVSRPGEGTDVSIRLPAGRVTRLG